MTYKRKIYGASEFRKWGSEGGKKSRRKLTDKEARAMAEGRWARSLRNVVCADCGHDSRERMENGWYGICAVCGGEYNLKGNVK